MARKNDTYVTYVQDNPRDAVRYANQTDYWDPDQKSYYIFGQRKCSTLWHSVDYRSLMGTYADMGKLMELMAHADKDNLIYMIDRHTHERRAVTNWTDIRELLDLAQGPAWRRFVKKLKDLAIVREIIIKGVNGSPDYKHYYVNPLITMGSRKISLQCYKLFQPELDKVLPARAVADLQRHWAQECGDTYEPGPQQLDTACVDAAPVIEPVKPEPVAEPPMTEADKFGIFRSYVLAGKKIQAYQLRNNGMFATTKPDKNKDLWFTPNRIPDEQFCAGRKKAAAKEITQYNNWFLDVDAGKDDNNNYYVLDEVSRRKKDMLAVIKCLPEPTAIVETRNGYHIYWSCYDVKDLDTWTAVETKLIDTIKIADPHARDVARLLRVPYSVWYKIPSEPYKIRLISAARNQYPAADMVSLLDAAAAKITDACKTYNNKYGLADAPKKANNTVRKTYSTSQPAVETPDNANIRAVKSLEIPENYVVMPLVPYVGDNIAREIKAKVSIAELLNLDYGHVFRCILDDHQDVHPSAMIYHNEQGGDRYVCSCQDRRGIDVIDLVQRLAKCTYSAAVDYLGKLVGIYSPKKVRAPKRDEQDKITQRKIKLTDIV